MDDVLRRMMLTLAEALTKNQEDLNKLRASVTALQVFVALQTAPDAPETLLARLQDLEQIAYAPNDQTQKETAAMLQALKNWTPKQSPDS
jgi:hypothetical protein